MLSSASAERGEKRATTTKCSTYLLTTFFFHVEEKLVHFLLSVHYFLVKYFTKEDVTMLHSIYNFGSGSISIILSSKNYLTFFNIHYLLQPFLSKCSMSLRHVTSFLIPLFKGFFLLVNEPEMYVLTFASGNRHTDEIEGKLIKSTQSSRNNDWTCWLCYNKPLLR